MATKRNTTETQNAAAKSGAKNADDIYSAEEFAQNAASVFGADVRSECVIAAFRLAEKKSATRQEAEKIVREFLRKEIR